MASLTIKLPDEQKSEIEAIAGEKNYNSLSEYVREALRDKVEEDLSLRPGVEAKLLKRLKEHRDGDVKTVSHSEILGQIGNDG